MCIPFTRDSSCGTGVVFYAFKDCIFEVNSLLPGPSLEFSKLLFGAIIPTSAAFLLEGPNFSKFSL